MFNPHKSGVGYRIVCVRACARLVVFPNTNRSSPLNGCHITDTPRGNSLDLYSSRPRRLPAQREECPPSVGGDVFLCWYLHERACAYSIGWWLAAKGNFCTISLSLPFFRVATRQACFASVPGRLPAGALAYSPTPLILSAHQRSAGSWFRHSLPPLAPSALGQPPVSRPESSCVACAL